MSKKTKIKLPNTDLEFCIPRLDDKRRSEALKELRWILNCWQAAIENAYEPNSPRRIEVLIKRDKMLTDMSMSGEFTDNEIEEFGR